MIKQLKIKNFRCYENSTITFNGSSILVGKNNAGKSTLIEALKIISSVSRKYKKLQVKCAPDWLPDENEYGVYPNVENMNISDRGMFFMYGDAPAIIEATFANNTGIKAFIGEGLEVFALIVDNDGYVARNNKDCKRIDIPEINVLPQISAVLDNEKSISKNTVDGNRFTRLASRNFRNQLYYYHDEAFDNFKQLVESTWDSLQISPVESRFVQDQGNMLSFFVRVNNFEAEIAWMGHGLQMWLQTMWFISQCSPNAIVVLDEPDVYMHADLQRRLVRMLLPKFQQLIIATHSLEIIEEVPSEYIIPIDSKKSSILPVGDQTPLQQLSEQLGYMLNIDMARIFVSKKFLIIDGDDSTKKILSAFQAKLFPDNMNPISNYPKAYVDGINDWEKAKTIANVFTKNKMQVSCCCIFNSGYNSDQKINDLLEKASDSGIKAFLWKKHEIENYALVPDSIFQYISARKRKGEVTIDMVKKKIADIVKQVNQKTISDNFASIDTDKIKEMPYDHVSGRSVFAQLSRWSRTTFGIGINALQVIPYIPIAEISLSVKEIIEGIMQSDTSQ